MKNLTPRSLAFATALIGTVLLLSACSTSPSTAPADDEILSWPAIEQEAELERERPETNDIPPATVLGRTTDRTTIYVRSNGSDAADGSSAANAVRSTNRAMELAGPSSTVDIGAGTFGPITIKGIHGTSAAPLQIRGAGASTVLTSNAFDQKAGVHIIDSSHIVVEGIHSTKNLWGVYVDNSSQVAIRNITVTNVGQEGVRFAHDSSYVELRDSTIDGTGRRPGGGSRPYDWYGEGVYVGTGAHGGDKTNNVVIAGNEISNTTAEAIDMKQETFNLLVEDNRIYNVNTIHSGAVTLGIGRTFYQDANAVIRNNIIHDITTRSQWRDGNAITLSASALVYNNIIWNTQDYGIVVQRDLVNHDANEIAIIHNTIDDTGGDPVVYFTGPDQAKLTLVNNIGPTQQGNIAVEDSMFENKSIRDYRLRANAQAIDAGRDAGVPADKAGLSRPQGAGIDMGALERPVNGFSPATTTTTKPTTTTTAPSPTPPSPTAPVSTTVRPKQEQQQPPKQTTVAPKRSTTTTTPKQPEPQSNPPKSTTTTLVREAGRIPQPEIVDPGVDGQGGTGTRTMEDSGSSGEDATGWSVTGEPTAVDDPPAGNSTTGQSDASDEQVSGDREPSGGLANAPSIEVGREQPVDPAIGDRPDELAFADDQASKSRRTLWLVIAALLSSLAAGTMTGRARFANRY